MGRDIALKELSPEKAESAELCTRFLKEARITGQLEHPGIVPVYDLA
jgi:serine/threonine-protein kinase